MPTRTPEPGTEAELRARLAAAEDELEDVRLFRPHASAIAEAEARVASIRAALARAPAELPARETPEPPPVEATPAAPAHAPRSLSDRLAAAFLEQVAHPDSRALLDVLLSVTTVEPDDRRLIALALTHLDFGLRRDARALRRRLGIVGPNVQRRKRPQPLLTVPPTGGVLVDLRDGLTLVERELLRVLKALGATSDAEAKPLALVQRAIAERGHAHEDELREAIQEIGTAAPAPLLELFPMQQQEPRLRLTPLGALLLGPAQADSGAPRDPLPTRVPYFLLGGRLGQCARRVPFRAPTVLQAAWRASTGQPGQLFGGLEIAGPGQYRLDASDGLIELYPEVELELGRAERRARLVVRGLPPPASWSGALERLEALLSRGALEGVTGVRLVASPARVQLFLDLQHLLDATDALRWHVTDLLRVAFQLRQQGLVDGQVVPTTPADALRVFLKHRQHWELETRHSGFRPLRRQVELLEGQLVAIELAEPLTALLRRCDAAVTSAGLAQWALEHVSTCASHAELREFASLEAQWACAVALVRQRLTSALEGEAILSTFEGGFTPQQAKGILNGRALNRPVSEVFEQALAAHRQLRADVGSAEQVRAHISAELDALNVASWQASRP